MSFKQALVVRTDLGMGKGKIAAQCAHAAVQAFLKASVREREAWQHGGQEKIVLKVRNEEELVLVFEKAKKAKLPIVLIRDAGHTQIPAGTKTVVGIGPCKEENLDKITGELKLL